MGGQFYHGTDVSSADNILKEGVQPHYGEGDWGEGFHVSPDQSLAADFTHTGMYDQPEGDSERGALLRGTVHPKNPKIFENYDDVGEYLRSKGHHPHETAAMSEEVRKDGHDFLGVKGSSLGLVLDKGGFHPNGFKEYDHDEDWPDWQPQWTDLT